MTQPKTNEQLRRIFGLAKPLGLDEDDLRQLAADRTGGRVARLSLLSFDEANEMIRHLGGDPLTLAARTPRRTVNHHRQQAGVKQISQGRHLKLMRDLARGRGISDEGLRNLCRRMLQHDAPRTTAETNKIIEALKAMNARDARAAGKHSAVRDPQSAVKEAA